MLDVAVRSESPDITCEFIKLCLRSRWDPLILKQAQALLNQNKFDWEIFCEQVEYDNLAPLVYSIVADQNWIPEAILDRLHRKYIASAIQNTLFFQELGVILSALEEKGISVILLKGAALSLQIYSNLALRPMVDIDLLVSPADTVETIENLHKLGFQEIRHEEQSGFTFQYENEIGLRKNSVIPILIEVHWNLFNSPYYQKKLSPERFWSTSQIIEFNDVKSRILQPEIQFLHLCGHLSYHHPGQEAWLWYHDLAEMIMFFGDQLNWTLVFEFAGKNDLLLSLKANLRILLGIYGPIFPRSVIAMLEHTTPSSREKKYYPRLSSHKKPAGQIFWDDLWSMHGWIKRLRFIVANLFPSPGYMTARYHIKNPVLLPFYYPYRWLRGIISTF